MNWKSLVAASGVLAISASGQEKKIITEHVTVTTGPVAGVAAGGPAHAQSIRFTQFDGGAVKGAPYAAEVTNETTQVLADGNRIVVKHTTKTYRDSEGRTRTENSFTPLGPLMPEGQAPSITTINDPVSGEHYILDNTRKSANKIVVTKTATTVRGNATKNMRIEMRSPEPGVAVASGGWTAAEPTMVHDVMIAGPATMRHTTAAVTTVHTGSGAGPDVQSESIGKQTIEGVECEGTRETFTIPAGQIGNERPLVSVTERWYSGKLKMDILRKHADPRFGETVYRLTRIDQNEQPRSLFEVPADYKVDEGPKATGIRINREVKE